MAELQKLRIDKWLWAVRIFKTRTMATDACHSGKVKINGHRVKAARQIEPGTEITVQKKVILHRYKVLGLIEKRVSAKLAVNFVDDLTPPEERLKLETSFAPLPGQRERGMGRPTKKERRQMEKNRRRF